MNLVTEQPLWYLLFCLIAAFTYALILYFKDSSFVETAKWPKRFAATFRFIVVLILAFFLLEPLLKALFTELEKPSVVIAIDNSESLSFSKDSAFYTNDFPNTIKQLENELSANYNVELLSFGTKVEEGHSFNYSEKQTDISNFLGELENRYHNRNLGAVILASDGIINKGSNPEYGVGKINAPIYTVALGDTGVKKDLLIKKVAHNRLAYLGNKFPLEIVVEAKKLMGKTATLKIVKGDQVLHLKEIPINSQGFTVKLPVTLAANSVGLQRYRVQISRLEEEVTYENNLQDIYIDVLDGRQKILLLANSPHPDIGAIRQTLEENDNYQIEAKLIQDFQGNLEEYNLVICHQFPAEKTNATAVLKALGNSTIPVWYIYGSQSDILALNTLQNGLKIEKGQGKLSDCQAVFNNDFSLFTLSDETRAYLSRFPPMKAQFGEYKTAQSVAVLLRQKIGIVDTQTPLFLFNSNGGKKYAILAGEGIWRWKLNDYFEHENHHIFNELISKTVQYLAVKENKSQFRVFSKNQFRENDAVVFEAEVYNKSYELINNPEVKLTIINEEGKEFPFNFGRTSKAYRLDAGGFPQGEYRYTVQTTIGGKIHMQKGEFSVSAIKLESINTVANHRLLSNMAVKTGGELIYPNELKNISAKLQERDDIVSISYSHEKLTELINLKWIFILVLSLLAGEWFIRKYNGSY